MTDAFGIDFSPCQVSVCARDPKLICINYRTARVRVCECVMVNVDIDTNFMTPKRLFFLFLIV